MSNRSILHLDADAFFASVEQAADARLRGKPVAVGGEKRGIIASASYEARKFGIYTPMPTSQARRLCPRLILLPGDFDKYELFSRLMFSYAYDFTPDVEIGSIDEGYFDLTGSRKPPLNIAETIRRAIRQSLKLSVSEGIGSNKLISQIASKLKKPAAFQLVPLGEEAQFLSPLANKWLPGIGPKTAGQLNSAGLARIGQIACTPVDLLGLLVGNMAPQLRSFALGIDERPIVPARAPAKSYSQQETFAADTIDEEFLEATLRGIADKLMAKVREDRKSIRTIAVKVRYNDMDEQQASESLDEPTDLETEIYSRISTLLRKAWQRRVSLRLVSLRFSNVYDGRFRSGLALDSSARYHDAQQRLADIVDELRETFGPSVVLRGHDFVLRAKGGRGEEPGRARRSADFSRACGTVSPISNRQGDDISHAPSRFQAPQAGSPAIRQIGNLRYDNEPPAQYHLAVLQRQRLGKYAARQIPAAKSNECRVPGEGNGSRITHLSRRSETKADHASAHPRPVCYAPLNVHSYYSFLDSTLSINAIVDLAKRHELPAIALTDKNNLHGAVEFAQAAAKAGIKAIIGAELEWKGHRVCLYVQNQEGYHNLCRILRESRAGGTPALPSPQINMLLEGNRSRRDACPTFNSTDGLLAVSPSPDLAQFFPGRFYLEINSLEAFEKRSIHHSITPSLHHSNPSPLPCVASFPVHYTLPSDRWKYDVVQSIRTLTLLRQQHPDKRLNGEYHFRSPAEMRKLFAAHPELLARSVEIAGRCSFEFSLGKPQFPGYTPPDGSTPAAFLRRLVMEGLQRRYPKDHARLKPQLEQELAIITEVGYEEYFLVMWDILQECRRRGIEWITRGSAADSLACYCLGISGVCPIRFDLYFRRFLNKDRMALNKLPDIDVDFPHDRKDDVIDLIFEKYGRAHTAVVGGFSTFQARSAFAEVAKVLGVSEFQARRITERFPHYSRAGELDQAVADTQECRDLPLQEEPYRTALEMAYFLDGFPRYPKMHPCGLVLSRQPMDQIVPCFISAKGYSTTHFDMDSVEAVGLVKMDILAQGGLAVMRDVKEMLAKNPKTEIRNPKEIRRPKYQISQAANVISDFEFRASFGFRHSDFGFPPPLDLDALEPWDDPEVWQLIANGHARAVHHIESPAMISLCKMCNVQDIDTLIAIVSVIRPGAANESKKMEFARRYQGLSPVRYPHPSLEPCLRSTYGLVVYEEHILQICEAFAGLPPGRADVLRRALAKDKSDIITQIQTEFADCARKRGRSEAEITEVWNLVTGFKGYAFCKAHSTAYGVEAYQSAWLKRYYPAQFMAAVLTNGKGFYDPLVYVLECHRLGISLLPPSINQPGPQFTVTECRADYPENSVVSSGLFPLTPALSLGERENRCQSHNIPKRSGFGNTWALVLPLPEGEGRGEGEPIVQNFRHSSRIRVPALNVKGLTTRTKETILRERVRGKFASLHDFFRRVQPLNEEMEALIRAGAFDEFDKSRTTQYWEFKQESGVQCSMFKDPSSSSHSPTHRLTHSPTQLPLLPSENLDRLPSVPLEQPDRLQRLRWEEELLGYPVSGHPLELYPDIAWETYCPINRLGKYVGEEIVTCGLVIEQRLFHQITGEPMKFLTIADWTGVVETELFAQTYKSYGLNTVRYRVLEITATIEPFENRRGFTLRVLRAGKPRTRQTPLAIHRS